MSKSARKPVRTLAFDTRGVSEAVSQAIIFMLVITAATGVSVGGQDVVDNMRDEVSFDQAVTGFEQLDEIGRSFATAGDQDQTFTASKQTVLYSRGGQLVKTEPTQITITEGGETYQVTSNPLRIEHDRYELTYDTGIIQSDRLEEPTDVRSPADQYPGNESMLRLMTTWTNSTDRFQGGSRQLVLIREHKPPEVVSVSDSATITVETSHAASWRRYFERVDSLENVRSTPTDSQVEVTADFSQSTTVYNQRIELEPADRFA